MKGISIFCKAFKNLCLDDSAAAIALKAGVQGSATKSHTNSLGVGLSVCIHVLDLLLQLSRRQHTFVAMAAWENQLLLK